MEQRKVGEDQVTVESLQRLLDSLMLATFETVRGYNVDDNNAKVLCIASSFDELTAAVPSLIGIDSTHLDQELRIQKLSQCLSEKKARILELQRQLKMVKEQVESKLDQVMITRLAGSVL
jgi:uncharacterized coiled-coil protein SlyX